MDIIPKIIIITLTIVFMAVLVFGIIVTIKDNKTVTKTNNYWDYFVRNYMFFELSEVYTNGDLEFTWNNRYRIVLYRDLIGRYRSRIFAVGSDVDAFREDNKEASRKLALLLIEKWYRKIPV